MIESDRAGTLCDAWQVCQAGREDHYLFSVGGVMEMPTMSLDSDSKLSPKGASAALFDELTPRNVSVTLVKLGFIRSDTFEKERYKGLASKQRPIQMIPYPYTIVTGKSSSLER